MPYALNIISLIVIISSILVITSSNPIISILYLITLFFSIATYLILIGITFIGLSYLLVYVGAVSILFIFILMLLNVRASELTTKTKNSIPLGVIIVILFSYPLYYILPNNIISQYINNLFGYNTILYQTSISPSFTYNLSNINVNSVSFVTSKSWDASIAENSHITSIGNILYTNYSIWLIITSIILLLAMVGCIVITINPQNHLLHSSNLYNKTGNTSSVTIDKKISNLIWDDNSSANSINITNSNSNSSLIHKGSKYSLRNFYKDVMCTQEFLNLLWKIVIIGIIWRIAFPIIFNAYPNIPFMTVTSIMTLWLIYIIQKI